MTSRSEHDAAVRILDEREVPHGENKGLGETFGLFGLAFRDPDNIQLELSAPYA